MEFLWIIDLFVFIVIIFRFKYYVLVNMNYGEIDFLWVWVESEGKFVLDYIGYVVEMGFGVGNIRNMIGLGVGYGG